MVEQALAWGGRVRGCSSRIWSELRRGYGSRSRNQVSRPFFFCIFFTYWFVRQSLFSLMPFLFSLTLPRGSGIEPRARDLDRDQSKNDTVKLKIALVGPADSDPRWRVLDWGRGRGHRYLTGVEDMDTRLGPTTSRAEGWAGGPRMVKGRARYTLTPFFFPFFFSYVISICASRM